MSAFIKGRDREAQRRSGPHDRGGQSNGHDDRARRGGDDRARHGGGGDCLPREGRMSGAAAVRHARSHLMELTGRQPEAVSALTRTRDGWRVVLEIVELERIPQSTDILASYAVEVDGDGDLVGYQRVDRYYRCDVGGDA
jgi:hypothetical protein